MMVTNWESTGEINTISRAIQLGVNAALSYAPLLVTTDYKDRPILWFNVI